MRNAMGCVAALAAVAAAALLYLRGAAEPVREPVPPDEPARSAFEPAARGPEYLPAPFGDRMLNAPSLAEPIASETAAFCDERNWSHVDLVVGRSPAGEFRVDEAAWNRSLASTKAGLASWMSQCRQAGGRVTIVAAVGGRPLATYDPESGLRLAGR